MAAKRAACCWACKGPNEPDDMVALVPDIVVVHQRCAECCKCHQELNTISFNCRDGRLYCVLHVPILNDADDEEALDLLRTSLDADGFSFGDFDEAMDASQLPAVPARRTRVTASMAAGDYGGSDTFADELVDVVFLATEDEDGLDFELSDSPSEELAIGVKRRAESGKSESTLSPETPESVTAVAAAVAAAAATDAAAGESAPPKRTSTAGPPETTAATAATAEVAATADEPARQRQTSVAFPDLDQVPVRVRKSSMALLRNTPAFRRAARNSGGRPRTFGQTFVAEQLPLAVQVQASRRPSDAFRRGGSPLVSAAVLDPEHASSAGAASVLRAIERDTLRLSMLDLNDLVFDDDETTGSSPPKAVPSALDAAVVAGEQQAPRSPPPVASTPAAQSVEATLTAKAAEMSALPRGLRRGTRRASRLTVDRLSQNLDRFSMYGRESPMLEGAESAGDAEKAAGDAEAAAAEAVAAAAAAAGEGSAKASDCPDGLVVMQAGPQRFIKAGTVERLVEAVANETAPDPDYTQTFLLTYRSFLSPVGLMERLFARFQPGAVLDQAMTQRLLPLRIRVCNVFKIWMEGYDRDFVTEPSMLERLREFVTLHAHPMLPSLSDRLLKHITLLQEGKKIVRVFGKEDFPPAPLLPACFAANIAHIPKRGELLVLQVDPMEFARQLTLVESRIFQAILPFECLKKAWSRSAEEAPSIIALAQRFNTISKFVVSVVLTEGGSAVKRRAAILKWFIQAAGCCAKLANYNAVMALLSGLHSSALHRMAKTWAALPKSAVSLHTRLNELVSRDMNFRSMRTVLRYQQPPCLPYLGLFLSDLTFIEDGMADERDGLINFAKLRRISVVIKGIQSFQITPYSLIQLPGLQQWIVDYPVMSEADQFRLSLEFEPRASAS